MSEPFGRAGWVLGAVGAASALALGLWPSSGASHGPGAWVFDPSSAAGYPPGVDVSVIPARMLAARCGARSRVNGQRGASLVVEVEIGSVGQYFRGPADETFFLPLNERLARSGVAAVLPAARLPAWRYRGRQLLLPRDVSPVAISYRADLFALAGVDLAACGTWSHLMAGCRRYEAYWAARGEPWRRAIELPRNNASALTVMLQQRGVRLIDETGVVRLSDPKLRDTLVDYAGWVASGVGVDPARTVADSAEALRDGKVAALFTPDWRSGLLQRADPALRSLLDLKPLPVFDPGDAPTATWGGTGIGIPRDTPDLEASWRLIESIYLQTARAEERWSATRVVPAVTPMWSMQALVSDPFVQLAPRVPPAWPSSPALPRMQFELNSLVRGACSAYTKRGRSGAEAYAAEMLPAAQVRLLRELTP